MIVLTAHSMKRLKDRAGLPKRACLNLAQKAYDCGFKHSQAKGKAKKFLDGIFLKYRKGNQLRVYGNFIYVFQNKMLITVLNLPKNMQKGFKK